MSAENCALKTKAETLASQLGIINKGEKIICQYMSVCDGSNCPLLEKQKFPTGPSLMTDNFYARLERTADLNPRTSESQTSYPNLRI